MSATRAYYNEFDPKAASWLRELIRCGLIADGDVDERSIEDVVPVELLGYNQCHFFAGIGGWSLALRRAGWPDDRPVWSGSCPCQPFSSAGKGAGFADERHLWPAFNHLIDQCRPPVVFGEQVASKAVDPWIDLVQADVEALGYAFGCVAFPSAGVGAPHLRDRAYWVADAESTRRRERSGCFSGETSQMQGASSRQRDGYAPGTNSTTLRMGHTLSPGLEGHGGDGDSRHEPGRLGAVEGRSVAATGGDGGVEHSRQLRERGCKTSTRKELIGGISAETGSPLIRQPSAGPTNGLWRSADWLFCRDGKWRPVEPGTFPLAHGVPARVGRLRGYGNAINVQAAQVFIEAHQGI